VARLAAKAAERIAKALRSEGNPYAPLMEAVAELLRQ
jgi:hypothetical protein